MKKIITTPKIIVSIVLSLVFIVVGITLGYQKRSLVQTVEAVESPEFYACMADAMADYMNTICAANIPGVKLLSPAWNVSNADFELLIPAMNTAGADFGCLDGIAVNMYNDGSGKEWNDLWTIGRYLNEKVRDFFPNQPLYITETGMVEIERAVPPTDRPDAIENLKNELAALSIDSQIRAILIFNGFKMNPQFNHSVMSNDEFDYVCNGNCNNKLGVNSASFFQQRDSDYNRLGEINGKFTLEIANRDQKANAISGINRSLAKGAQTIVRIGVGQESHGFTNVQDYIQFLKDVRAQTTGDFYAIAGPNEPDLERWIAPQCSGGNPPAPTPTPGGPQPTPTPTPEVCKFERPSIFGVNPEGGIEAHDKMLAAGFKSVGVAINWDVIEPQQNQYNWTEFDDRINNYHNEGYEIVSLIIGTPSWAAPNDNRPPHRRLPHIDFQSEYEEFLRMAVERYPMIKKYQFWNEENACGSNAGSGCRYDVDSYREYAYWLGVTYDAIKDVDNSVQVAIGGLDGASDDQAVNPVQFVKDLHTASGGRSYDAIAHHPYNWTGVIRFDQLEALHDLAPDKEIWITEYGWDVNVIGDSRQASFLESSLTKLMDPKYSYITVALFHTFGDFSTDPRMGLMEGYDDSGTQRLRPREAYNVFIRIMQGAKCGGDSGVDLPPIVEGWLHPGIDIEPIREDALSNNVFSTHAGFVTYAGPPPPSVKEKGWLVQIEADLNRDNVPDVITRYTHLLPGSTILVNDVRYKRRAFTPECFANLQACFDEIGISSGPLEKLPYGYGPYVARNQLIGMIGDSGSPGRVHIQYEVITNRYISLYGSGLATYDCRDNPYLDVCITDYSRPGFFFPLNRKRPDEVRGPVYTNPGFVTPPPVPPTPTLIPTPTPGPTSCLNEVVATVTNADLRSDDQREIYKWGEGNFHFEQATITGKIYFRGPNLYNQHPEFITNGCFPDWEGGFKGLVNTNIQIELEVVMDDGIPERRTMELEPNSQRYKDQYIGEVDFSFTIPARATYKLHAGGYGRSGSEWTDLLRAGDQRCMETYVWSIGRNLGADVTGEICGVPINCDRNRTNIFNPYCGLDANKECSDHENAGKYWAHENPVTRELIHWRACQP